MVSKTKWVIIGKKVDGSRFQVIIRKKPFSERYQNFNDHKDTDFSGYGQLRLSQQNLVEVRLPPLQEIVKKTKVMVLQILLHGNHLKEIDLSPLHNVVNIDYLELYLQDNHLETIDLEPLSHCKGLVGLDLSNNRLSEINLDPLKYCKNLRLLDLSNNLLKDFDFEELQHCTNLYYFDLRGNALSEVDINPFGTLLQKFDQVIDQYSHTHTIRGVGYSPPTGDWRKRKIPLSDYDNYEGSTEYPFWEFLENTTRFAKYPILFDKNVKIKIGSETRTVWEWEEPIEVETEEILDEETLREYEAHGEEPPRRFRRLNPSIFAWLKYVTKEKIVQEWVSSWQFLPMETLTDEQIHHFTKKLKYFTTIPDAIISMLKDSLEILEEDPMGSIGKAGRALESLLSSIYEEKYGKIPPDVKMHKIQMTLNKDGVIPDVIDVWISTVRILRNRCVHPSERTLVQVTKTDSYLVMNALFEKILEWYDKAVWPFYCQICFETHKDGRSYFKCQQCSRHVCYEGFEEMRSAGRENCPNCDGLLLSRS